MKKFLLTLAALGVITAANAQQTYNYFDPKDCDADGWLWFDSQAKLEKYCGWSIPGEKQYKIGLLSATFENSDMQYEEPQLDGTIQGFNAAGERGGADSWTGAVILNGSKSANGSDSPNGGGIILQLPDLAEFSLALSTEPQNIGVGLRGAKGWVEDVDCQSIYTNYRIGFWGVPPLATSSQYTWDNIQDVTNQATEFKLASPQGEKVTAVVRNNRGDELYVQGIKVFTYTQTDYPQDGAAVAEIEADENAPVEFFNLQGMKVSGDEPGIYVRRQGSKVSKVIVK